MSVPLSLVIPAYNRADLIEATLASAFAQTVPFAQIVVVDDGSTDGTADVLAAYGDRITVIATPNRGVQAARNTGVAAVRTDYFALLDSDDLLEPEFVATVGGWLATHGDTDAVYVNFHKFSPEREEPPFFSTVPADWFAGGTEDGVFVTGIPDLYLRTIGFQALYVCGLTLRKAFYDALGGYDTAFNHVGAEDWEFTLRTIAAGRVALCRTPLARVRKHPGNDSFDQVHMTVGEAQILEYALAHHRIPATYAQTIRDGINKRRWEAAINAYAQGRLELARRMLAHPYGKPMGLKFTIKKVVVSLPPPLRQVAWRLTTMVS
jgi:GT2 family glycosyltransferase